MIRRAVSKLAHKAGRGAFAGAILESTEGPSGALGCRQGELVPVREAAGGLLGGVDDLLLDCDGVLWRGSTFLPGVVDTLNRLQADGRRLFYITNNATKTRSEVLARLICEGVEARIDQIYTSAYALALYLRRRATPSNVYVLGMESIHTEVRDLGMGQACRTSGLEHNSPDFMAPDVDRLKLEAEKLASGEVRYTDVVVGLDRYSSWMKLSCAALVLNSHLHPNAEAGRPPAGFLATNPDVCTPLSPGVLLPSAGSYVKLLEAATGREATLIGKPSRLLFDLLCENENVDPRRAVMVGDRMDTDVAFGKSVGVQTLLVLTGVEKGEGLERAGEGEQPDYILPTFASLLSDVGARGV